MDPTIRSHPSQPPPRRSSFGNALKRLRHPFRKPLAPTQAVNTSSNPAAPTPSTSARAPGPSGTVQGEATAIENIPRSQSVPAELRRPRIRTIVLVERLCHKCGSLFVRAERTCLGCGHRLCDQCPRDPLPRRKLATESTSGTQDKDSQSNSPPPVYERTYKKPRVRIRYMCDKCNRPFEEKRKTCTSCGHERCDACLRSPPKRSSLKNPDPAVLKALETRLEAFTIPLADRRPQSSRDADEGAAASSSTPSGVDLAFGV